MNDLTLTKQETEVMANCQTLMSTTYDNMVLANFIANQIALPTDKSTGKVIGAVNVGDVLQVAKLSASMHLDPLLGGVYGFKDKNGKLTLGVSKKGWQQSISSHPDFYGIKFVNHGELKPKKVTTKMGVTSITYYEAVTCIISKKHADGTVGEYEGTAYFDEEFDANKPTWLGKPKRMLESRALTIAASNAYGCGAYEIDEVQDIQAQSKKEIVDVHAEPIEPLEQFGESSVEVLPKDTNAKEDLIKRMKKATSKAELARIYKSAEQDLKDDEEIINLGKELSKQFGVK